MIHMFGQKIGDYIGVFLEFDENNSSNFWRSYMRIHVLVNVRITLKKAKRVKKAGGEAHDILFKYEHLGPFCFYCGLLGHLDDGCDQLFNKTHDDGHCGWGLDLYIDIRGTSTGLWWLCEENQHANLGHVENHGSREIYGTPNSSIQINNIPYPGIIESHQRTKLMSQIFKIPTNLFPLLH
uniref:Zinc knuckle CX2CX4HX4C domain-containing protein n=1 Tax=Cajanus cajan TaxID=3821 RepID=A0A151SYL9_CAJCA|nr:hypothetical protein KK1_015339 [Cajanus cajan]